MYYLVVGLAGGLIAVLISILSRSNLYILSALLPFFPLFTMITYFVNKHRYGADFGNIIRFNIVSISPFLMFALSMYFLHTRLDFYPAIGISLIIWFLGAFSTYHLYNYFT